MINRNYIYKLIFNIKIVAVENETTHGPTIELYIFVLEKIRLWKIQYKSSICILSYPFYELV